MRIVISDRKTGKTYQVELEKGRESQIVGKTIGDKIDGGLVGASGYTLELTGGSDDSGFPMRSDMEGIRKINPMLTKGTGFKKAEPGQRKRKMIRGNTYHDGIVQINTKIVDYGTANLDELFGKKEGGAKQEEKK